MGGNGFSASSCRVYRYRTPLPPSRDSLHARPGPLPLPPLSPLLRLTQPPNPSVAEENGFSTTVWPGRGRGSGGARGARIDQKAPLPRAPFGNVPTRRRTLLTSCDPHSTRDPRHRRASGPNMSSDRRCRAEKKSRQCVQVCLARAAVGME